MKKYECICNSHCDDFCQRCGRPQVCSDNMTISPDLYAAEFLLYAFHFQPQNENIDVSAPALANPLMLLLAEG